MPKKEWNFPEGEVLLIDKPLHWTSFDVVAKIRNMIRFKKIGHAGTLDPLATGLLILCTGKKTKSIEQIQNTSKRYIATIFFGATTPTYDSEFPPENHQKTEHLSPEDYKAAFQAFIGDIKQTPPIYSAVKVNGVRAYALARKGKEVELKERTIQIYSIQPIEALEAHKWKVEIHCSKGTYIRSLANDLGKYLGVGAYLMGLQRTAIGDYHISNAYTLEDFYATL